MSQKKLVKKSTKFVKFAENKAFDLQSSSTKHVDKYLKKRAKRLLGVRRFVTSWLLLVVLLIGATIGATIQLRGLAQTTAPADGGTYTAGALGSINNLNPMFSNDVIDDSAARLLFNGLLRYDTEGHLTTDLASKWSVDDTHKVYTVDLRKDVHWQDGQDFTADDVVYTIKTIQDPAARSTLYSSWQGVTVSAPNKYSVQFSLPAPFAPFPSALTLPILPKHILGSVAPSDLRSASFNTSPIGTGPFIFQALRNDGHQQQLEFVKNAAYYRGAPHLDRFVLHTYPDEANLLAALQHREITAAVDLKGAAIAKLSNDPDIHLGSIPLNSGVFAFFKTTAPSLSDATVRSALVEAINRQAILSLFGSRYAPLKTPLLPSQLGYDARYQQVTDVAHAKALLDQAGWKMGDNGVRTKDGTALQLNLVTVNTSEYSTLANELQKQWAAVGVSIKIQLLTPEQLQQNALTAHTYDILLYGISLGYDPDVYAYWHSSQARVSGLNLSEWKSTRADASLDVARTRLESVLRVARYQTFLDEWQKSAPAVALYQPQVSYAYYQNAHGFVSFPSNSAADRLTNVEDWTVNTKLVQKTP